MIMNNVKPFRAGARRVVRVRQQGVRCRAERDFAKDVGGTAVAENQLKTERYIATNRFKVKPNAGPKFEQRWASRKSRLAELDGFRYFQLMRRVPRNPGEDVPEGAALMQSCGHRRCLLGRSLHLLLRADSALFELCWSQEMGVLT